MNLNAVREELLRRGAEFHPLHKLLWRLGFRIKPPQYQSFITLAFLYGIAFGIVIAMIEPPVFAIASLYFPTDESIFLRNPWRLLGMTIVYGVAVAVQIRHQTKKLNLPPIDQLCRRDH